RPRRSALGGWRRAGLDVAPLQRGERRPLHYEGADHRHHGRRRQPPRRAGRRPDPRHRRDRRRPADRSGPDHRDQLHPLPRCASHRAGGPFRQVGVVSGSALWQVPAAFVVVALLAAIPLVANDYHIGLAIDLASYTVLATAWALFSGPTRYISLATAAFFG